MSRNVHLSFNTTIHFYNCIVPSLGGQTSRLAQRKLVPNSGRLEACTPSTTPFAMLHNKLLFAPYRDGNRYNSVW